MISKLTRFYRTSSTSITQDNPYSPLPLSARILINDGMALLATLVYGIFAHFAIVIITQLKK